MNLLFLCLCGIDDKTFITTIEITGIHLFCKKASISLRTVRTLIWKFIDSISTVKE
ncbi:MULTISPECIES: hypothetical protein [unclassified Gilliamella]|uniref:hypothetical protein n=1 Tax=unclassified Gilliamella TaxID=2685620 RepID=UPI00226AD084|nr:MULTISPECIES: hypothetical protein [unclassified Gilliamella]MCX8663844.1 hypothetical protein [Gilliamella sp. B2887]MCX8697882.1 hypothetical protein [Gilliamella sp. B3000]